MKVINTSRKNRGKIDYYIRITFSLSDANGDKKVLKKEK